MFSRKLKVNFKNKLMRDDRNYENLSQLVKIAINIDDKLYERAMKRRYNK